MWDLKKKSEVYEIAVFLFPLVKEHNFFANEFATFQYRFPHSKYGQNEKEKKNNSFKIFKIIIS